MSGRVQDPTLGIFLSPDPIVQSPFNSQGFNRYSYVRNNPATFIDPSGYSLKRFLKRWVGPLFGGGIAEGAGAGLWGGFAGFIAATAVNIILDRHTDQSSAHFVQQAPANNTNAQRHAPTGIGPVVGTGVPSSGASTAAEPFFGTPEAARREAYRQLPYGSDVNVEWGVEISRERVNGQYRYYVGTPVPGRAESVTYDGRIFRNPDDGKIVNPDGREIVELAHTHLFPRRVNWEGNSTGRTRRAEGAETFSGGGRGLDSDIGIAEQLQIPVSMRIGDSLKIYDPKVDRAEPRTGGGYRNAKGRTICNEGCFE
jgi:hypothetical protein